ncbi:hypothetical protein Ciccas_013033, partial [Cichlidogyrus casuarinus]
AFMDAVLGQRGRIEEALDHGSRRFSLGAPSYLESEVESDGSDFESENDRGRRLERRIKRHLVHLKDRYSDLCRQMYEHERRLTSLLQKFAYFESLVHQVWNEITKLENLACKWNQLDKLSSNQIKVNLDKTRQFQTSCVECSRTITDLDEQMHDFRASGIHLSVNLTSRVDDLRIKLARLQEESQNRTQHAMQLLALNEPVDAEFTSSALVGEFGLKARPQLQQLEADRQRQDCSDLNQLLQSQFYVSLFASRDTIVECSAHSFCPSARQ